MALLRSNLPGSTVQIYDMLNNLVATSVIASHDSKHMEIELGEIAIKTVETVGDEKPGFRNGETYRLRILSKPNPCEYLGTAKLRGSMPPTIALYQGKERELRRAPRYNINMQAEIESLIYGHRAYPLHSPLLLKLVNISKSGARISAIRDAMSLGDQFEMNMDIDGKRERLIARVMNCANVDPDMTEYGCAFLAQGVEIERVL